MLIKRVIADYCEKKSKEYKSDNGSDWKKNKAEAAKRRHGGFESKLFQKYGYFKIEVVLLSIK